MSGVSCSKEDELQFKLLLKPCMDISMWKGYDPDDHDKNAAYFEPLYKRLVPSSATVDDTLNKYQVRHMPDACCSFWQIASVTPFLPKSI